jgi:hypothetical protein
MINNNMSDILNQQQSMMKRISDFIEQEKEKLNTIYSECITKMNDSNPNKQVYENIDELHKSCYGEKKGKKMDGIVYWYDMIGIQYWYDMNMEQFINPIENYNGMIYKSYDFEIKSIDINNTESVKNKILISQVSQIYSHRIKNIITDKYRIKLQIDNYLNIYVPEFETIIINNYTKFPHFVLDSQYHKHFNKSDCVVLNEKNPEDKKCLDTMSNIHTQFKNYPTSKDQRDKFNDGELFRDILYFLNYDKMIIDVKLYLDFASKLRVYGKEDDKIQKELELKTQIIESKDKEIERLKTELKELLQFYIDS